MEEIEHVNECIDATSLLDLDSLESSMEHNVFDASCYNGDACKSSSG